MSREISAPVATAPVAVTEHKRRIGLDNRYVAPVFITCILLAGHLSYGILESYPRTLLAIVASIVTEIVLGRIFFAKWPHLASAYITGISVGILLRSPAFWPVRPSRPRAHWPRRCDVRCRAACSMKSGRMQCAACFRRCASP